MKTQKKDWPAGVWHDEPDERRWEDSATGLQCFIRRGPAGTWFGYVGVRDGHPAFGIDASKYSFDVDEILNGLSAERVSIQKQINDISVHGGLTYSGSDELRGLDRHWFGFDCDHAGDFCPAHQPISDLGRPTGWGDFETYRTIGYVEKECANLAAQLAAIDPKKRPARD